MPHEVRISRQPRKVKSVRPPPVPIKRAEYKISDWSFSRAIDPPFAADELEDLERRAMPEHLMPGGVATILERIAYKALYDIGFRPPDLDFQSSMLGGRMGWRFGRQVADIAIHHLGIIVEVQGQYWHNYREQPTRDVEREMRLGAIPRKPAPWRIVYLDEWVIRSAFELQAWLERNIIHAGLGRQPLVYGGFVKGQAYPPEVWIPVVDLPELGRDWVSRSPVNHVINGGFDAHGSICTGWTTDSDCTASVSDGKAVISASVADKGIYQAFTGLTPNAIFTIVCKVNTSGNSAYIYTTLGAKNVAELVTTAVEQDYTALCVSSDTGTLTLHLTAHSTGVNVTFDDVALYSGHLAFPFVPNFFDAWRHPSNAVYMDGGDIYASSITADKFAVIGTAGGARIQINTDGIEGYKAGPVQTFDFATDGTFWFGAASGPNSLSWNGSTLTLSGAITIESGSGIANLTDAGDLATADDLDDVADGSTYNKTTVNEVTGAGRAYADIDASGNYIGAVDPAHTAPVAGGAGLYLGSDYLGYYSGTAWNAYIANDGKFQFKGDATNLVAWDGSTLSVKGAITVNSGSGGGWTIDATSIRNTGSTVMLRGAGNLAFGATPPTAADTGTGLFLDATGLYGLNANTQQFYLRTSDGRVLFGDGAGVLDSSGVSIDGAYTSEETQNSVRWLSTIDPPGGNVVGRITGGTFSSYATMYMFANPDGAYNYGAFTADAKGAAANGHRALVSLSGITSGASVTIACREGSQDRCAISLSSSRISLTTNPTDTLGYGWSIRGENTAALPLFAPTLAGETDYNTGIWQSAADNLDFSTGGTNRLNISSAGLSVTGAVDASSTITSTSGAVAAGVNDTTSGIFTAFGANTGAEGGQVTLCMTGDYDASAESWVMDVYQDDLRVFSGSNVWLTIKQEGDLYLGHDGAVGTPVLTWAGDPDTGIYRITTNSLGIAAGGALAANFTANGINMDVANVRGQSFSLAQNRLLSFTPITGNGVLVLSSVSSSSAWAVIHYNTAAGYAFCVGAALGSSVVVGTGALLDNETTTGTVDKVNVNTHTDGKMYIKNRFAATYGLRIVQLAG